MSVQWGGSRPDIVIDLLKETVFEWAGKYIECIGHHLFRFGQLYWLVKTRNMLFNDNAKSYKRKEIMKSHDLISHLFVLDVYRYFFRNLHVFGCVHFRVFALFFFCSKTNFWKRVFSAVHVCSVSFVHIVGCIRKSIYVYRYSEPNHRS